MESLAHVAIHASQFLDATRRDLLESLRRRRVNHKFLYDSPEKTRKWLALHESFSPSRTDPNCAAIYDQCFETAAASIPSQSIHVIGLGCGGGQKDSRLLTLLKARGANLAYTPCDVSVTMVLVARQTALAAVPALNCHPFVCDLATTDDLPALVSSAAPNFGRRLFTFFGMIPNFEPEIILPKLAALLQPDDALLFSANLAPGGDYDEGMRRILPQYDNSLTRDWLLTFLADLGVETHDGELRFAIEPDQAGFGLKRVDAGFHFKRPREIQVDSEHFHFNPRDSIGLFFSYRYTPALVGSLLMQHRVEVMDRWIAASGEEGVFLCRRR